MNFAQYRAPYSKDGYVVVPAFLSDDDFSELNENLDRYIRDVVPTLPNRYAFYQEKHRPETLKQLQFMGENDLYFRRYIEHVRWKELAEALLGEPLEFKQPQWFNKPPNTNHATPPHQDNYYFCLRPPSVLTMWLALDRVNEENGGLRYIPGSHRLGLRSHSGTDVIGFSQGITDYGPDDEAAEVLIRLEPGDLVCHHGELIHRAGANGSKDLWRRAFALVAEGVSCRHDEEALHAYQVSVAEQHASAGLKTKN